MISDYKILSLTREALNYLTITRCLSPEVLDKFRIGSNERGEIVIPFYNENDELVAIKFRSPNGSLLKRKRQDEDTNEWTEYEVKTDSVKGSKPVLLGSHLPTDFQTLYICYGDYDAMTISKLNVTATSLPYGDRGTNWIEKQWDWLEKFQKIVFCPDYDENPKTQAMLMSKMQEMSKRLGKHRCYYIPEKSMMACKDINELQMEYDIDNVEQAIKSYIPVPEPGLMRLAEYVDEEFEEGTPCGIAEIDKATGGFAGGGLTILAADNNHGKTTGVLNLIANFLFEREKSFYWTGEQKPRKVRWWLEQIIAGPKYIKSRIDEKTKREYYFADPEFINDIRSWYWDGVFIYDKRGVTSEQFWEVVELVVRRYGVTKIFIDNLMAFTSGETDEFSAQKAFVESCKNFAEDWNVHVFLVAHNKKEQEQPEPKAGEKKRLRLPDKDSVHGAKAITNWADFVIQIIRLFEKYRIPEHGMADGIWSVCKNRETGDLTDVRITYDKLSKRTVQYTEADKMTNRKFGWEKK